MSSKTVECSIHGERSPTFVCHHLLKGEGEGFNVGYDPDEPDALYPDAWCDACEEVVDREGEWNDRSEAFADIRLLCSGCYCETRERNWKEDEGAVTDLITQSFEYLQSVQESFKKDFRLDDYERWDWNEDDCKLIFSMVVKLLLNAISILLVAFPMQETLGCGRGLMSHFPRLSSRDHDRSETLVKIRICLS